MKQTIRINQVSVRVPQGTAPRGKDVARRVSLQIARKIGRPIAPRLEATLTERVAAALRKRGY